MFDSTAYAELRDSARALADARTHTGLATGEQLCDAARAVQQAQDILDGVAADLADRIEETRAYEAEGCPTAATWMARELRVPIPQARARVAAGRTLRRLPEAADALAAGEIRFDHVRAFTSGLKKLGEQTLSDAMGVLLPVAKQSDTPELREAIDHLHQTVCPDDLDNAWARGMDKRDLKLARCGDGFHVSGFLDQLTGAKVHAYLKAASAGDGPDDSRSPSERRVDAIGRLVDSAVDQGQPGTGIRPQVHVLAELDTLLGRDGAPAAELAGFGPIGRDLLGYLTCATDLIPILVDGSTGGPTPQANVLNVGRTRRLANPQQRAAVIARQHDHCANPGCTNTQLEVHHVAWWDRDHGATDLANLVGLCSRCHHLVHQHKLAIRPDGEGGFTFLRSTGKRIDDHIRQHRHRIRRLLRPRPRRRQPKPVSVGEDHLSKILENHRPTRTRDGSPHCPREVTGEHRHADRSPPRIRVSG